MKVVPNYGNSAFIVPGTVLTHLKDADKTALMCLLYVLETNEFNITSAATELGIGKEEFLTSLRFWEEAGVIKTYGGEKRKVTSRMVDKTQNKDDTKKSKTVYKKHVSSSLPAYTTEETAKFLEENARTAEIIDSCENIIGKIFTTAETNIIIGMMDHLSLSGDYILLLFAHAAKIDKKSVRYVEKLALSFVDRDITKYHELEEELANIELAENTIRRVRTLFGLGGRVLTPNEKSMITNWCVTWNFGDEIIEKAYEITANSTGKAPLKYANAVLENWYKAGITTIEQIEKYSEEFEQSKKNNGKYTKNPQSNATPFESSFDTDDFFEAALKRSYQDDTKNT